MLSLMISYINNNNNNNNSFYYLRETWLQGTLSLQIAQANNSKYR